MAAVLVSEEDMLRLICGYVHHDEIGLDGKQHFYDLRCDWYMHNADDLVMSLGEFNVHVGKYIDGVDGGYGVGQSNLERRALECAQIRKIMCVKYMT